MTAVALPLDLLSEIDGGGLAFDRRVRRQDHLFDIALIDSPHQIANPQLLGADSEQRRDGAMQHMVDAVEVPRLFNGADIGRFFYNADHLMIASRIAAIDTRVDIGNVVALRAKPQILLYVADSAG